MSIRKLFAIGFSAFLIFTTAPSSAAQEISPSGSEKTLRVSTSLVNMIFVVRDKAGKLVTDLSRDEFRIMDNGRSQPITYFSRESDLPLYLVLAFDKSSSVKNHLQFQLKATFHFLKSVISPDRDRFALLLFDKRDWLATEFTNQLQVFQDATAGLRAEQGTALFDAAAGAIHRYMGREGATRKVLVLVTDGEDTVSMTTEKEVLKLALSSNVIIYALGVKADAPGADADQARKQLSRLSDRTGGSALFPDEDPAQLSELFVRIAQELRFQYNLAFTLPPADGRPFHQVTIHCDACEQKGYIVATRLGYYYPQTPTDAPVAAGPIR